MPLNVSSKYSRTSRIAGYCASGFILLHYTSQFILRSFMEQLPDWLPMVWGWLMLLAMFSAVVCLTSGLLGYLRGR
jgi:hypothetical protein